MHLVFNLVPILFIKKKLDVLRFTLITSYDSPILSMLLSTVYVSTGSLKDIISIYRDYKNELNHKLLLQTKGNYQNIYFQKNQVEIFNSDLLQSNFREIIVHPNIILTNFNDFIKSIEIISTFEENYLSELDDKIPLIIFAYFFLPFVVTQIYLLLSNSEILLLLATLFQLSLLSYFYVFISKKLIELNKIREAIYGRQR